MTQNTENESPIECRCCFESFPMKDMFQCHEGHFICRSCIENVVKVGISSCTSNDKCPCADGCSSHFSAAILEKVLSPEIMKKFDEIEAHNSLENANIPYLRKCWKCAYLIIDDDESCPMCCPECNQKTCKKCGKKFHPSRTCEEADIDPMRFVEDLMSKSIIRECPSCHLHYYKEERCNHMTCPKCKVEFCHMCGVNVTGQVSEHFKKCQQNIDNKKYNEEQIQKAKIEGLKKYQIDI